MTPHGGLWPNSLGMGSYTGSWTSGYEKAPKIQQKVLKRTIPEWRVHAGGQVDRKEISRISKGLGGQQVEHEPAVQPWGNIPCVELD